MDNHRDAAHLVKARESVKHSVQVLKDNPVDTFIGRKKPVQSNQGASMVRYYFDLLDGDAVIVDEEGMELPSLEAAQIEAAQSLADMTREAAREIGRNDRALAVEVRDSRGPILQVKYTLEIGQRH